MRPRAGAIMPMPQLVNQAERTRGRSWSILPAYTLDGYLDSIGIKEGWFSGEDYYSWINNELLTHLNAYPAPRSVIVMANVSTHTNSRVEELLRGHGCWVLYLPPYSPDYNPIELTISVLRAWIRRYFHEIWPIFGGDFGFFLRFAVAQSRCDRVPEAHFRHSRMHIFQEDIKALERELEQGIREFKETQA